MPYWCPYSRSKRPCVICALILLVNLPFNRSWPGISSKSPVSESTRLETIWTHRMLFATRDGNKLSYILTKLSAFMHCILAIGLFDKNLEFSIFFWNQKLFRTNKFMLVKHENKAKKRPSSSTMLYRWKWARIRLHCRITCARWAPVVGRKWQTIPRFICKRLIWQLGRIHAPDWRLKIVLWKSMSHG